MTDTPAPALYVHIPFCASRCRYCGFSSSLRENGAVEEYLACLKKEIAARGEPYRKNPPATIFIGGGTPSFLELGELETLFSHLPAIKQSSEVTIEINPDSLTRDKLNLFQSSGITRLSFGVQTFSPQGLTLLGRRHSAEAAVSAVKMAQSLGSFSLSIDLITAWPGQTLSQLEYDLNQALSLGINHLSCYNLILEDDTGMAGWLQHLGLEEMDDTVARKFWDMTESVLGEKNFQHYEISNFSLPGAECKHNINYWQGGDYIGIGASAHSYVQGKRTANCQTREHYIEMIKDTGSAQDFSEMLSPEARAKECAVFWLRLAQGINQAEFVQKTSFRLEDLYGETLNRLLALGYLEYSQEQKYLRLAPEYYPVADGILADLV